MAILSIFSESASKRAAKILRKLSSKLSSAGSSLLESVGSSRQGHFGLSRGGSSSRVSTELDERRIKQKADREVAREETLYFKERYRLGKQLGKGHYSVVRKALDSLTDETVAVKCIKKSNLSHKDYEALQQEIDILESLEHPNIIYFLGHYQTKETYFIVTEFARGGELFDRIVERTQYSEFDARETIRSIASALQYCHRRGIVHRDLKPENILLQSTENDTKVKIADFGFAKFAKEGLHTALGTPGYIAPEILQGVPRYTAAVDLWSLGVITYILLCGYPPFHSNNRATLYSKIKAGDYDFHEEFWQSISYLAKVRLSVILSHSVAQHCDVKQVSSRPEHMTPCDTKEQYSVCPVSCQDLCFNCLVLFVFLGLCQPSVGGAAEEKVYNRTRLHSPVVGRR